MENRLINYWKDGRWFQGSATTSTLGANAGTGVIDGEAQDPGGTPIESTASSTSSSTSTPTTATPTTGTTKTAEQLDEEDRIAEQGVVEAGMAETAKVGAQYGLDTGADTIQGVVDEFKDEQEQVKTYTQEQIDRQNALDLAEAARFGDQAEGAIGATTASFAQGREGAVSGTASSISSEFTTEMNKQIQENQIRLESAQAQRNQLMLELEQAQASGKKVLAEQIEGQLANARVQIDNAKANVLNALTAANEQAQVAMESTRQSISTFTGMVDSGATMTTESIISTANALNIPFETAYGYYQGAEDIRDDSKLSLEEKQVKLDDLSYNFNLEQQGYVTEQAKQIKGITDMVSTGSLSQEQAQNMFVGLGIDSSMNPFTRLDLSIASSQAKIDKYEADNLGQPPAEGTMDRIDYDIAQLELRKAEVEASQYSNSIPESTIKDIFTLEGQSNYRANGWECGEGYNKITDGVHVGDSFEQKMSTATKQDSPQIGNGLVTPHGGTVNGHIGTVIDFNPVLQQVTTVDWNYNGNGSKTVQTTSIDKLNEQYGENWGFTDSKLKSQYSDGLTEARASGTGDGLYSKFLAEAKAQDLSGEEATEFASNRLEDSYAPMTDAQTKSYTAYATMQTDGDLYNNLIGKQDDIEAFVNNLNVFTQKIKRYGLTAEAVNRTMDDLGLDDVNIRRLLMAEMRWTEAYGRKQSGAAIKPEEYDSWATMFFPRASDDIKSIEDKNNARKIATDAMYTGMGAAGVRQYEEQSKTSEPEQNEWDSIDLMTPEDIINKF